MMKIAGSLGAEFSLAQLPGLWLQASYADEVWTFSGETRPGQSLSLREIREQLLPMVPPLPFNADLAVSELKLVFSLSHGAPERRYSLDCQGRVDATWEHGFGQLARLTVEKLQFRLEEDKSLELGLVVAPFSLGDLGVTLDFLKDLQLLRTTFQLNYRNGHFQTYLQGGLQIKEFTFQATFTQAYDEATQQNTFQFLGEITNSYSLAQLGFFGGELRKVLPSHIQDLTVTKLAVQYHSKEQVFRLEAHIKDVIHFDVNVGKLERVAVDACTFEFQVSPKATEVRIVGDLSINQTKFQAETVLSAQTGLSLEVRNLTPVTLNFKDLTEFVAGDMGVWDAVPPFFHSITFETLQLVFQTSPLLASLNVITQNWGSIYGGIGKLNGQSNGVLVAITPPGHIPFSQLHPELAPLEMLDFEGSYLILSSFGSHTIRGEYLPPRLQNVDFIDGLTFCAALSLVPERIQHEELRQKMIFFRKNILDVQQLSIKGTLGVDPAKIAIEGYVGKISLGGGVLELSKAGVSLSAMLDFTVFGNLSLDLSQLLQLDKMSFSMYLKVHANGLVGYGIWEGNLGTREVKRLGEAMGKLEEYGSALLDDYDASQNFIRGNELFNSEPFQRLALLPDLQIRKVGLVLGINWEGIPSFGALGEFTLNGDEDKYWGMMAFVFDSANPSQCLVDLKFPKNTFKSLQSLVMGFQKFILEALGVDTDVLDQQMEENPIFGLLDFDGFYEDMLRTRWVPLRAKVAVMDVKIGNVFYDMGILVQGKIGLLNNLLGALFNLKITRAGIYGFGKLKKLSIRHQDTTIFALGESQQSVVPRDVALKQNLTSAQAEFEGPYITLNAPFTEIAEASLHGSAHILFMGIEVDSQYSISTQGIFYSLTVDTPLGNLLFQVRVGSLTEFMARSEFDVEFNLDIFSLRAKGSAEVSLREATLKARLNFSGEFFHPLEKRFVSLGNFDIEFVAPPELVKVFTDVLKTIEEEILRLAGAAFEAVRQALAQLAEEIKALAEEVKRIAKIIDEHLQISQAIQQAIQEGKEAVRLIGAAIDQIKAELQRLGQEIENLKQHLHYLTQQIEQKAQELARELERAINEVGTLIVQIIGSINNLTLPALVQVRDKLQGDWNWWEAVRIENYHHRMAYERDRNGWNWLYNTTKMGEHFVKEAHAETMKTPLIGPIHILNGIIGVGEGIQNEINRLEAERQNTIINEGQKQQTLEQKQWEENDRIQSKAIKESRIAEQEQQLAQQEAHTQQAQADQRAREAELARLREQLREVTAQ